MLGRYGVSSRAGQKVAGGPMVGYCRRCLGLLRYLVIRYGLGEEREAWEEWREDDRARWMYQYVEHL
jgi:hypothetical protein